MAEFEDYNSILEGEEIDSAVSRALPGGEIDGLLAGKAPDGFGLGKNIGMSIIDGNEAVYGGNYRWGNTTQNLPFSYGFMGVTVRADGSLIQTAYSELYLGCSAQRKCTDGTFGAWEWVNPPMQLGEEYRTTERYRGKPVYTMAINTGSLGKNTADDVPHNIANVDDIWVSGGAMELDGNSKFSIPYIGGITSNHVFVSASRSQIHRIYNGDAYNISGIVVEIKYTKLTD